MDLLSSMKGILRQTHTQMAKQLDKSSSKTITINRKARHEYFIEEHFEAGLVLEGWEVKSLRAGRSQMNEAYAVLRAGELWLIGAHISPLLSASSHISPDPTRSRKLLLKAEEIKKLIERLEQKGMTLIPLSLCWKNNKVKCDLGLAKGKKQHDKRETAKKQDWQRERARLLKNKTHDA